MCVIISPFKGSLLAALSLIVIRFLRLRRPRPSTHIPLIHRLLRGLARVIHAGAGLPWRSALLGGAGVSGLLGRGHVGVGGFGGAAFILLPHHSSIKQPTNHIDIRRHHLPLIPLLRQYLNSILQLRMGCLLIHGAQVGDHEIS